MKYGIGITTRNRPLALRAALQHFSAYYEPESRIVVIDDASEVQGNLDAVLEYSTHHDNLFYYVAPTRGGVSASKNACLHLLRDCEHVFLFDDDSWPVAHKWAERWVQINQSNGVGHSMFNIIDGLLLDRNPSFKQLMNVRGTLGEGALGMTSFSNCFGPLLYFSRDCLNAIGGYPSNAPSPWGYEHAQMSQRAWKAGFTQDYQYLAPNISHEMIYSVDMNWSMLKMPPPLDVDLSFGSSVSEEEKANGEANNVLLRDFPIHIPLEAPSWLT